MPGVPSSRGCQACRKLKKRCDQLKPVCSRCSRLCIPCIGSGQQRYKFQNEEFKVDPQNQKALARRPERTHIALISCKPVRSPISKVDILTKSFISAIEVRDLRYNLNFLIPFYKGLIPRLGSSDALYTSVEAITVAYSDLRKDAVSVEVFHSYGKALRALRLSLDDPAQATAPETLTAIYLLIIFQGFIQKNDSDCTTLSHAEILVYILNAATCRPYPSEYELEIMFAMTYTVLFSSILNPKIVLHPWFPKVAAMFDICQAAIRALKDSQRPSAAYDELLTIQEFVCSPWNDLHKFAEICAALRYPLARLSDIEKQYQLIKITCETSQKNLARVIELMSLKTCSLNSTAVLPPQLDTILQYCQTSYGIVICFALLMSAILQVANPEDEILAIENEYYCQGTIRLGQRMSQYRPLGATFIPVGLSAVSTVSRNFETRRAALDLLLDYSTDFKGLHWMESARWFNEAFDELRSKLKNRDHASVETELTGNRAADGWGDSAPPNGACFVQ